MSKIIEHDIQLPAQSEDLNKLEAGHIVYLNGLVYTAREGVYARVMEQGAVLPDIISSSNVNFHCSPAAASDGAGSFRIGGVTATASFRFSKYMAKWLDLTQTRIVIGKGGMPEADYKSILVPRGAIYLTTVGYGTGALLGRGVKSVHSVHWLEELGLAQAMWVFEVQRFGPFIVDGDLAGNSLFASQNAQVNAGIDKLYEGLKKPALHRFGETDDRSREIM